MTREYNTRQDKTRRGFYNVVTTRTIINIHPHQPTSACMVTCEEFFVTFLTGNANQSEERVWPMVQRIVTQACEIPMYEPVEPTSFRAYVLLNAEPCRYWMGMEVLM